MWMLLARFQTTAVFPRPNPRRSFPEGPWALTCVSCAYSTPGPLGSHGWEAVIGRQTASHWGHHDGLQTDLWRCIEGCVHEVTGLKPARWAVTEQLSKQFSRDFSFVGFLIFIVKLSHVDYVFSSFLQGVSDTRDENC